MKNNNSQKKKNISKKNSKIDIHSIIRERYIAGGQVQGVGFRPFVYKLATFLELTGRVGNSEKGVLIEVQGTRECLDTFFSRFVSELPPMARLESLTRTIIDTIEEESFEIILTEHKGTGHSVLIGTDMAHCEDCRKEMLDKNDARYLYPFINCTNCGPRYSITHSLPYDRETTSMACFPLCESCAKEYSDPLDRRFHAQPTACHECGVEIWTESGRKGKVAFENTLSRLAKGKIVAIKGLGGFHLSCNAMNILAIKNLRKRKSRPNKAFAVMVANIDSARQFAYINEEEEQLLTCAKRPIVLCKKKPNSTLPNILAPDTETIGLMLPSSPLHELLFCGDHYYKPKFEALVMTSGNISGEPIALGNREAFNKLTGIADHFLFHNRDILVRVDDSVLFVKPKNVLELEEKNKTKKSNFISIRRARAFVPEPLDFLPFETFPKTILALGADLKATCAITKTISSANNNNPDKKTTQVFVGQHIGNMENLQNQFFMQENIEHLKKLLAVEPDLIITDAHPNSFMRSYADDLAQMIEEKRLFENSTAALHKVLTEATYHGTEAQSHSKAPIFRNSEKHEDTSESAKSYFMEKCTRLDMQHHAAHAYSLLADNTLYEKMCVLILDGTGYGLDGTMWGGEAIYINPELNEWNRIGHFTPSLQPANDMAVKRPWYMAESFLLNSSLDICQTSKFLTSLPFGATINLNDREAIRELCSQKIGIPTSSCGRLFDAIGVILGCEPQISYEGQVPMQLEAMQNFNYNEYEIVEPIFEKNTILFDSHTLFNNCIKKLIALRTNVCCYEAKPIRHDYDSRIGINKPEISPAAYAVYAKVARYFHLSLAHSLALWGECICKEHNVQKLGLTGGVMLNKTLLEEITKALQEKNITPIIHQNYSPSDASISLGQAYYAYLYSRK